MCSVVLNNFDEKTENFNTIINENTLAELLVYKNKIDELENTKIWDRAKKFSNEYELIHLPNKRNKKDSIALYEPLSRSYFKMCEMIYDYKLLDYDNKINICCLAEGPGGFIECINNIRNKKDYILGITLKSSNREVPGWKKTRKFFETNTNVKITYGADGTGDLYNLKNILYLQQIFKDNKCSLITADGGFDFSLDFNNQEKMSYRIIYCEIVCALAIQIEGGNFVCKIFDIHTEFTAKLLYILLNHYREVYICKPKTSRSANSEKYIICKNYKGISHFFLRRLMELVDKWDKTTDKLNFVKMNSNFMKQIYSFNELITKKQTENIKQTLEIIDNYDNIELTSGIIENQKVKAVSWCNKYNIDINEQSSFLC